MDVEKLKTQQEAFRTHQASHRAFMALADSFAEEMNSISAAITDYFRELGVSARVDERRRHNWTITFPPSDGWITIAVLCDLTFNAERSRSEFVHPRGAERAVILPLAPMALPIDIMVSGESGGVGWASDIWWRSSSDNQRLASIAIDAFKHKRGPRELRIANVDNCFIATEIFGDHSVELTILRRWRDRHLLPHAAGRVFVSLYYRTGPLFVRAIRSSSVLRTLMRTCLTRLCGRVQRTQASC